MDANAEANITAYTSSSSFRRHHIFPIRMPYKRLCGLHLRPCSSQIHGQLPVCQAAACVKCLRKMLVDTYFVPWLAEHISRLVLPAMASAAQSTAATPPPQIAAVTTVHAVSTSHASCVWLLRKRDTGYTAPTSRPTLHIQTHNEVCKVKRTSRKSTRQKVTALRTSAAS